MEIWKSVVGYEGLYEVSDLGRVKSLERKCSMGSGIRTVPERILSNCLDTKGYLQVNLYISNIRTTWKVHRLVALSFIDNPESKETINHINGVKTDNMVENLEWSTQKENTIHAHKTGLANGVKGSNHYKTTLSEKDIFDIKYTFSKKTGIEVAKMYGISAGSVSAIRVGKRWIDI